MNPMNSNAQCVTGAEVDTAHPKKDMRGVFLPSVVSISWPTNRNATPAVQQAELIVILDNIQANGYNTAFLQVRPESDALYISSIDPWSYWLTGAQGTAPSPLWDPLQFAIDESHARGLDLHAWLNPYRAKRGTDPSSDDHVTLEHPEWIFTASNNANLKIVDPGIPAARAYIVDVIEDIATRYDLDGIHFDDYFYPSGGMTNQDAATFAANNPGGLSLANWRRDNVNKLIADVYDAIQTINTNDNKNVVFGVSPAGIWKSGTPSGTNGNPSYSALYCDTLAWMAADKVDYIAPQVYWDTNSSGQDYDLLTQWWNDQGSLGSIDTQIYVSQAYYKMDNPQNWAASEIQAQINRDRMASMDHTFGQIAYRYNEIGANLNGINSALNGTQFQYKSFAPPITGPGKDAICPNIPNDIRFGDLKVMWDTPAAASDGDLPSKYVVYAFDNVAQATSNKNDGSKILDIVAGNELTLTQSQIDTKFIVVTSLDKNNNEAGDFCNFPLQDFTAQCLVTSLTAPTAKNNCAGSFTATTNAVFPIRSNTVVTWNYDFGGGNTFTQSQNIVIENEITEYTATGWSNGAPHAGSLAKISDVYSTNSGNIVACACEVTATGNLTVEANQYILVDGDITVDAAGTLTVAPQGSIVQVDDNAIATNNGSINIAIATTELKPRDFVAMGSPMSTVTREGDLAPVNALFKHNTANFIPYPGVMGINFLDDNFNDYAPQTGILQPGEGFLARPRPLNATGNEIYSESYTEGTLNNGVVNYVIGYNGNQNSSYNLLANPYPSAIDAREFIADNAMVNEVYLWEHVISPNTEFPGANSANHSMENVSMFNLTGPTTAAGATQPNNGYLSTAQGFGILATAGGTASFTNSMRIVDNNNTLRTSEETFNRVWLTISNETYSYENTTLIGFTSESTDELDAGYDTSRNATVVSLFSHLDNGTEQLGIQGRADFNADAQVKLGFATIIDEMQTYTISLDNLEGLEISQYDVYLVDKITGQTANLSDKDYTFSSAMAEVNDRFIVQFVDRNVLGQNELALTSIAVYPNPTDGNITINSPQALITSIDITDASGRLIQSLTYDTVALASVDLSNLGSAMYFVIISTEIGQTTKLVIKK